MTTFNMEMRFGQPTRVVEADHWEEREGWMVFFTKPPQGGRKEYWRVQMVDVVSMETRP